MILFCNLTGIKLCHPFFIKSKSSNFIVKSSVAIRQQNKSYFLLTAINVSGILTEKINYSGKKRGFRKLQ